MKEILWLVIMVTSDPYGVSVYKAPNEEVCVKMAEQFRQFMPAACVPFRGDLKGE